MSDGCVICGEYVPEGSMVCGTCVKISKASCEKCDRRTVTPRCHDTCGDHQVRGSLRQWVKARHKKAIEADILLIENARKSVTKNLKANKKRTNFMG
jgi:hypothetical protein